MRFLSSMTTKTIRTSTSSPAGSILKRGGPSPKRTISPRARPGRCKYERQHGIPQSEERQRLHKMVNAIEARDIATVTDLLTERSPTFTARELDRFLVLADMTADDRAKFRNHVLHDAEVVGLRESQDAKVTRYTTRKVLQDELAVLRGVDQLAGRSGFGVERRAVTAAAAEFTLIAEQAEALGASDRQEGLRHAVGRGRDRQKPHPESGSQRLRARKALRSSDSRTRTRLSSRCAATVSAPTRS